MQSSIITKISSCFNEIIIFSIDTDFLRCAFSILHCHYYFFFLWIFFIIYLFFKKNIYFKVSDGIPCTAPPTSQDGEGRATGLLIRFQGYVLFLLRHSYYNWFVTLWPSGKGTMDDGGYGGFPIKYASRVKHGPCARGGGELQDWREGRFLYIYTWK